MITHRVTGDITGPENERDIIIAMNTELGELSALGRQFLDEGIPKRLIQLGSILTFQFDEDRLIHMAICHNLCDNGWREADRYLRFCLDTLWMQSPHKNHSIVEVGNGVVGKKYGANPAELQEAMHARYLEVTLFQKPAGALVPNHGKPLNFLRGHSPLFATLPVTA